MWHVYCSTGSWIWWTMWILSDSVSSLIKRYVWRINIWNRILESGKTIIAIMLIRKTMKSEQSIWYLLHWCVDSSYYLKAPALHFKLQMHLHSMITGNNNMEDFLITSNPFLEPFLPLLYFSSNTKIGQFVLNSSLFHSLFHRLYVISYNDLR